MADERGLPASSSLARRTPDATEGSPPLSLTPATDPAPVTAPVADDCAIDAEEEEEEEEEVDEARDLGCRCGGSGT